MAARERERERERARASCIGSSAMEAKVEKKEVEKMEKVLKLFGVNIINRGERMIINAATAEAEEVEEEVMRKSFSMGNLASCTSTTASGTDRAAADAGYISDGGLMQCSRRRKGGCLERKRGTPWTEEEHRIFLAGLEKLGKGDWRGISRNFVTSRTPTQVASHAQKYFLRQSNPSKKKRRSSLFDVVINGDQASSFPEAAASALPAKKSVQDDHIASGSDGGELSNFPSAYLTVKHKQIGSISKNTGKDNQVISFQKLNNSDPMAAPNQSSNISFAPDLLGLSLTYPHSQAQPSRATPSVDVISDLELRIAPPQPHMINKISSSQGAADAIRVV